MNAQQFSLAYLFRLVIFAAIILAISRGYPLPDSEWNHVGQHVPKHWLLMNIAIGAAIGGAASDMKNRLLVGDRKMPDWVWPECPARHPTAGNTPAPPQPAL